jgi:hypothetical protein
LGDKLFKRLNGKQIVRRQAMYRRTVTLFFRTLVSLVAAGYLLIHPGGTAAVAAQLSPQQVSQFLANPSALIAANPDGGGKLVASVRDLMLSDPSPPAVLNELITLLKSLNSNLQSATETQKLAISNQISAIGAGLGQAAQALASTNVALANQVQTALAASGVQLAIASYLAETANVQIGSTGGGGSGGGPVSGGAPMGGGGGGGGGISSGTSSSSTGGGLTGGGSVTGGSASSTLASDVTQ